MADQRSGFDELDDDDDYFSEVDDGNDTGNAPRFFRLEELELPPTVLSDMKVDELFTKYIALRDQLSTDRKGWKAREARMKSQMLTIGGILMSRAEMLGVQSLSASTGTGYKQERERIKVAPDGWDDLTKWILETGNFQIVQRRVSPDAVREVREETGDVPPGVEVTVESTFVVRSPTVRKR